MSSIEKLCRENPFHGDVQIHIVCDDTGALSAQFENGGSEIFCGGFGIESADSFIPGEKPEVEGLQEEMHCVSMS